MDEEKIPQLRPFDPENQEAYKSDPMLGYIMEMVDNWQQASGKKNWSPPSPNVFVRRMERGAIDNKNEWWQNYLQATDLQLSLEIFGIDTIEKKAQFFYLCLLVKDYACACTEGDHAEMLSPRENIHQLITVMENMKPKMFGNVWMGCENECTLTISYRKKGNRRDTKFEINDGHALVHIKQALEKYLEENHNNSLLDGYPTDYTKKVTYGKKHTLYLFKKYIFWYLQQKKKVAIGDGIKDLWSLIATMIYIVGLSTNTDLRDAVPKLVERKNGNKVVERTNTRILKGIISDVKDKDFTSPVHYWPS